jgi:hypothetical protein
MVGMAIALLSLSRLAAPAEPTHGSPIADARESLDHWSRRAADLPWHKRAARREARVMVAASRARLIVAHLERWGLATLAGLLAPLLDTGGRSAGAHARSLALSTARRTPLGRHFLLAAGAAAAAGLASLALIAALVTHLLGLWSF